MRWNPARLWRIDGAFGQGQYEGTETNGRRSGYFGAQRGFSARPDRSLARYGEIGIHGLEFENLDQYVEFFDLLFRRWLA